MRLAVTGIPDSHRGPFFLVDPDGQRAPTCFFFCFFWSVSADFVTSVGVSVASAGVLTLAGLRSGSAASRRQSTARVSRQ